MSLDNLWRELEQSTFNNFFDTLEFTCEPHEHQCELQEYIIPNNCYASPEPMQDEKERLIGVHLSCFKRTNGRGSWENARSDFRRIGKFRRMALKFEVPRGFRNFEEYSLKIDVEVLKGNLAYANLFCCSSDVCCKQIEKNVICNNLERKHSLKFSFNAPERCLFRKTESVLSSEFAIGDPSRRNEIGDVYSCDLYLKPQFVKHSKLDAPLFRVCVSLENEKERKKIVIYENLVEVMNPKGESRGPNFDQCANAVFEEVNYYYL
jgi:hypothetical protein